jgi:hypothetical protein
MKTLQNVLRIRFLALLILTSVLSRAAEVSVPDPGLESAIRDALHKASGALTEDDLLSLKELDASQRNR